MRLIRVRRASAVASTDREGEEEREDQQLRRRPQPAVGLRGMTLPHNF